MRSGRLEHESTMRAEARQNAFAATCTHCPSCTITSTKHSLTSLRETPDSIRSARGVKTRSLHPRLVAHMTFPVEDRRAADRPTDPACRTCNGAEVKAVLRTEMAVYFRCYSCNRVWGKP